jgi:hypothetical protein
MTALCFCYAEFRHQLQGWWQSHGGGVPYVLFFIFLIYTIIPKVGWALRICALVVLVTCGLEVLQLWNPELLATFRKTRFGAALLGTTFVWNDFPPYFIGGAIGWVTLRANRWGNEKESGDDFGSAHEKRTTE